MRPERATDNSTSAKKNGRESREPPSTPSIIELSSDDVKSIDALNINLRVSQACRHFLTTRD